MTPGPQLDNHRQSQCRDVSGCQQQAHVPALASGMGHPRSEDMTHPTPSARLFSSPFPFYLLSSILRCLSVCLRVFQLPCESALHVNSSIHGASLSNRHGFKLRQVLILRISVSLTLFLLKPSTLSWQKQNRIKTSFEWVHTQNRRNSHCRRQPRGAKATLCVFSAQVDCEKSCVRLHC